MMAPGNYEIRIRQGEDLEYQVGAYLYGTGGWLHYLSFKARGAYTLSDLPNDLYRVTGSLKCDGLVELEVRFSGEVVRVVKAYPNRPPRITITLGNLFESETGPLAAIQLESQSLGREISDFLRGVGHPANEQEVREALVLANKASNLRGQIEAAYRPCIVAHQNAWRQADRGRTLALKALGRGEFLHGITSVLDRDAYAGNFASSQHIGGTP